MRRRPQRRVRRKLRAVRGAPSEAGEGGRRGSKGPEEGPMDRRGGAVERRRRMEGVGVWVDAAAVRGAVVVGGGGVQRAHLRIGIAGRNGENGRRLAPAMPRRHMLAGGEGRLGKCAGDALHNSVHCVGLFGENKKSCNGNGEIY